VFESEQTISRPDKVALQQGAKEPVPTFEEFWRAYSPDAYMSQSKTERHWRRMIPAEQQKACKAIAAYLADCRTNNRKRVSVLRYLRDRIWQGFSPTKDAATRPTAKPGTPEWNAWRKYYVAIGHPVGFFDDQGRQGKAYTVPSKWPPDAS
jgi:hypothetical protein